eukprot:2059836-Pyramimonas_sp.AAC.2
MFMPPATPTGFSFNSQLSSSWRGINYLASCPTQGRILNRASADLNTLDSDIYYQYGNVLTIGFQLVGVLVVVCVITPGMLVLVIALSFAYYRTMRCAPPDP